MCEYVLSAIIKRERKKTRKKFMAHRQMQKVVFRRDINDKQHFVMVLA